MLIQGGKSNDGNVTGLDLSTVRASNGTAMYSVTNGVKTDYIAEPTQKDGGILLASGNYANPVASASATYVSDDAPPESYQRSGQRWWVPSEGLAYIWYEDGDSGQWVQENSATAPMPSHNDTLDRNAVGAHDDIYIRAVTLAEAQAGDAPVGTRYTITDLADARYDVVDAADTGGFYKTGLASGRKLKLAFDITSTHLNANELGLVYDSRGQTVSEGTDNLATIQAAVDLVKTKPVGLFGEFTGGVVKLGFGGLLVSDTINMTNNAAVSLIGMGKTKTNLFVTRNIDPTYMINLTGSNNCRNEIKGLRMTTIGGSEGVIRSGVSALGSTSGANQIDVKENWFNNLQAAYTGVASDSSIKDNTAEYCRQFVSIQGGGSRDLDVSENVVYNCGNIGLPTPSDPLFEFSDIENLTITRNRVIADSAAGPFDNGIYNLTNVSNFDISDQKFNDTHSYVGEMFKLTNSSGRLSDIEISSGTGRSLRAVNCEYLEIDKYVARNEKAVQDDVGMSFVNCPTIKVGTIELGETGLVNMAIDGSSVVTIDTLILNGAKNVAAVGGGFDQALRIVNCGKVSINTIVIKTQSVGSLDVLINNTNTSVSIGRIIGTTAGRVSVTATNTDLGAILP